jgi:hypothetical protein
MVNKPWNGKTASEWLQVLRNGNRSQCNGALFSLHEMLVYAYATGERIYFQIAKAVAEKTHSKDETIRIRAYGILGVLARYFAFDLLKGDESKKRAARVALLAMIRESNSLHSDLFRIVPDLADKMVGTPSTTKNIFDGLVTKLNQELAHTRGNARREIDAAIAHVNKVRDK